MAAIVMRERHRNAFRRERVFRDRKNPLEVFDDLELINKFRFNRAAIIQLTDEVGQSIAHPSGRSGALPPILQVCITLRVFATGSFQDFVGESIGVHQSTVSRTFHRVLEAFVNQVPCHLHKPTAAAVQHSKAAFAERSGFPGVFGAIDCTHVRIQAPHDMEHEYINRKNFHSINVQGLCDEKMIFLDCVARNPGSVHDARILRESPLFHAMERQPRAIQGLILGDSGYPLREWLMTPFLQPQNAQQEAYNTAHSQARCVIERAFGVLKRRWHILHCGMRVDPTTACKVILVCFMLHNIATRRGLPVLDEDIGAATDVDIQDHHLATTADRTQAAAAKAVRLQIVRNHF